MKYKIEYINGRPALEGEAETFVKFVEMNKDNLSYADLAGAYLKGADLTGAYLTDADLKCADLTDADIDFGAWPLWCGTRNVKVDKKIAAQIATHFCWLDCDDEEVKAAQKALELLAKQFEHWEERK